MNRFKTGEHTGVTWVQGLAGWSNFSIKVFLYLVDEVLIDTGPARLSDTLLPYLDQQKIAAILLTHYHEDHSGNAPYLASRGIPAYINAISLKRCHQKTRLPLYRKMFWGNREAFFPYPMNGDFKFGDLTWVPVFTPGHVFDHQAFYLPERGFMFTGDLFVTPRPRMILNTENTPHMIEDLKTVLRYDFTTVFCSHAGIVARGKEMLQKKLEYLQEIQEAVLHLHHQGWSVSEITRKIFPGRVLLEYLSGREWSAKHMVKSMITGKASAAIPKPQT